MKTAFFNKSALRYLAVGILGVGVVLAQRPLADPAAMAQRQVERLTKTLNLTAAQQSQATTIFTASDTGNEATMASFRQARTALAAAIKANDVNGISTASNTIGTLTAQLTASSAKADAAFYVILTPDQQANYTPGLTGPGRAGGFGGPGAQMRRSNRQ